MDQAAIIAYLAEEPFFGELEQEDIETLSGRIEQVELAEGQVLFEEGDPSDAAYLIREGEIEILKQTNNRDVLIALRGPGTMIGEMSLLEGGRRTATARSRGESSMLKVPKSGIDHLLAASATAAKALLRATMSRLRETETLVRHSENMAQLGKMTAGIAHELNNPTAAALQTTTQLQKALERNRAREHALSALGLNEQELGAVQMWMESLPSASDAAVEDPLARYDLAEGVRAWCAQNDVGLSADMIGSLVEQGVGKDDLESLQALVPADGLAVVAEWAVGQRTANQLVEEIEMALRRVADIVAALKGHVYLDQAPVQRVDINESIRNAMVLLKHKLTPGIEIKLELGQDLPEIEGYGSELNQVWTNLITNAIDALEGSGRIIVRTRKEGGWVIVEVEDNGPGIPPGLISKVFDPFVTSKDVGKGTGLGLNITYNIVVFRHRGDLRVRSEPGETCFAVWLPIESELSE